MHETVIHYIIGVQASQILALLAFFLAVLYFIDFFLTNTGRKVSRRREGLLVRALNWGLFGFIFLFFGKIIPLSELEVWRAGARIALFFLILSESLWELTTMWPELKRALWRKRILP